MKKFKKPRTEIITEFIRNILRLTGCYNKFENELLSEDFNDTIKNIKETNSKIVFDAYYVPKAISAILKEDNLLISAEQAYPRATAMMLSDMANGILTEFYKFKAE